MEQDSSEQMLARHRRSTLRWAAAVVAAFLVGLLLGSLLSKPGRGGRSDRRGPQAATDSRSAP
jgi:hypothetical protein